MVPAMSDGPAAKRLPAGAWKIAVAVAVVAVLGGGAYLLGRTQRPGAPEERAIVQELAIVNAARAALRGRAFQEALAHAGRHKAKFPSGRLSDEREAIAIQSLVELHRQEEARQRAESFQQKYPDSLFLPAVNAAVAGAR